MFQSRRRRQRQFNLFRITLKLWKELSSQSRHGRLALSSKLSRCRPVSANYFNSKSEKTGVLDSALMIQTFFFFTREGQRPAGFCSNVIANLLVPVSAH